MGPNRGARRCLLKAEAKPASSLVNVPSKSLYLFFSHSPQVCTKTSYSICKINLNDLHEEDAKSRSLSPVLELDYHYPRGMGCALLDSKLYILGGDLQYLKLPPPINDRQLYPRHVYQVDTTESNLSIRKMDDDMELNTGKPAPCVFAAEGKIYVLGSKFCPTALFDETLDLRPFLSKIKLFECFDPNTNRWHVLDNPPVDECIRWEGCNVFEHRRQVLVRGNEVGRHTKVLLLYNLIDGKWTRHDDTRDSFDFSMISMALSSQEAGTPPNHLYGIYYSAPVKSNLVITDPHSYTLTPSSRYVPLSFVDNIRGIFREGPYIHYPKKLLRYLGDHHFCHINYGLLPHPRGPDRDGYLMFDVCSRGITITLFKEISHDDDNIDGNSTSKRGGKKLRHRFLAKFLHSQQYLIKSRLPNMAKLVECFVVSPEPKAAAPVKKASPTTKLAKVVESDYHRDKRSSDYEKPKKMVWVQKAKVGVSDDHRDESSSCYETPKNM